MNLSPPFLTHSGHQMVPMTVMENVFGQRLSLLGSTPISLNDAQGPYRTGFLTVPQTCQASFCPRAFALTILSAWDILVQIYSWLTSLLPVNVFSYVIFSMRPTFQNSGDRHCPSSQSGTISKYMVHPEVMSISGPGGKWWA